MVTSLTNLAGWIGRLVLSAAVLCFNAPLLVGPDASRLDGTTREAATEQVNSPHEDGSKSEFHATVTLGKGKKQVTVQLEFGRPGERSEDEAL